MLGDDEHEVGEAEGQGHFHQRHVAQAAEHGARGHRGEIADHDAAQEDRHEQSDPRHEADLGATDQQPRQDREQNDGGGVVEEAFPLDQHGQALRRAQVLEQGDHRHRVGGRDDRGQQETGDQGEAGDDLQGVGDDQGRDQHPDHREHENRYEVAEQAAYVDAQRRFEDQGGQEEKQDRISRDLETAERGKEVRDDAQSAGLADGDDDGAQHDAHRRHQHRVGQAELVRRGLQQADDGQQHGDAQNRDQDVAHPQPSICDPAVNRRLHRRTRARQRPLPANDDTEIQMPPGSRSALKP
jgi:hypothetical protein